MALSWIPKATIQGALGGAPLDQIRAHYGSNSASPNVCMLTCCDFVVRLWRACRCLTYSVSPLISIPAAYHQAAQWLAWGSDIQSTAVFYIILTAPVGLCIIGLLGPRWLVKVHRSMQWLCTFLPVLHLEARVMSMLSVLLVTYIGKAHTAKWPSCGRVQPRTKQQHVRGRHGLPDIDALGIGRGKPCTKKRKI